MIDVSPDASANLNDWLAWQEKQHPKHIDLGLDRVSLVAERLSLIRPNAYVISVAGTNGKGSTCAFLEQILLNHQQTVGVYTSPHLFRYNERIRVNGNELNDQAIVDAFVAINEVRGDVSLTYFEWGTLAAMVCFKKNACDYWVLEVGLGGRLDAVNVIDADVSVVTSIGLDHQHWLGKTREAIAREKLGIARVGKPLIVAESDWPNGFQQLLDDTAAQALCRDRNYWVDLHDDDWMLITDGHQQRMDYPTLGKTVAVDNAAAAIMALAHAPDLTLSSETISQAIASVRVQGRQQIITVNGIECWCDVAHNPDSAKALANALSSSHTSGKTIAVFSALEDKDVAEIADAMKAVIDEWYLVPLNVFRGLSVESLRERFPLGAKDCDCVEHVMDQLLRDSQPGDRLIAFGSFHLVAEAIAFLNQYNASEQNIDEV